MVSAKVCVPVTCEPFCVSILRRGQFPAGSPLVPAGQVHRGELGEPAPILRNLLSPQNLRYFRHLRAGKKAVFGELAGTFPGWR